VWWRESRSAAAEVLGGLIKAFWNYSLSPSLLARVKPARTRPNHCALVLRKYTHHLERFAGRCRGVEALLMQKQQFAARAASDRKPTRYCRPQPILSTDNVPH
jgi:hypothetical protein